MAQETQLTAARSGGRDMRAGGQPIQQRQEASRRLNDDTPARKTILDEQRFRALWSRCATLGNSTDVCALFARLLRHYQEPHRRYHTPGHVTHCLREFDSARAHMTEPDAVELAIWFHDAIYDARAHDNEAASAAFFEREAKGDMPESLRHLVHDLIMITTHTTLPSTNDECFIVDIDLSGFGLPWQEFIADSAAVRAEFSHQSDAEFIPRHRAFIESLLKRKEFCFTAFFREKHEQIARSNIERYLAECMRG